MSNKENSSKILCIITGIIIIIVAAVGILYSNGGERFTVVNMYGNTIELYGDGIYAFNSVLAVGNRLGADVAGIMAATVLIVFTLWKKRVIWVDIVQTSIVIFLAYYSACLVFGISMNRLYLLYIICFGTSLFLAFKHVQVLLNNMVIPEAIKNKRLTGVGIFLIIVGVIIALLWGAQVIQAIFNRTYGSLLEIQTTEFTFGVDLSITSPIFIICGIWVLRKKDIGYKVAPLLLSILVEIAIMVISQKSYCTKLGIDIPVGALIGFIISFVIMGVISLFFVINLLIKMRKEEIGTISNRDNVILENRP